MLRVIFFLVLAKIKTKGKIQHPDKLHKIKANVYVDTSHQQKKYPEVQKKTQFKLRNLLKRK